MASESTPMDARASAPSLFLRNATGLVKGWSGFDAFVYAFMSVNLVCLGMFYSLAIFAYVPDGSAIASIVLTGIAMTFMCIAVAGLIAVMPRAGGDYVWQTRVLDGIPGAVTGGAFGAIAMFLVGVTQRSLGWREVGTSLIQTAETSGMIFLILLGAEVFNAFLGLSQLPTVAASTVAELGLPAYAVIATLLVFYILLGAIMDELAMLLLTLPLFFPIVTALDVGLLPDEQAIWFGILVLIVVGIGLTAPPIGLNVFVVSAIARDVPITRIYGGVLPFIAADLLRLALCVAFPGLSLVLVRWLS
jgi:TRAP-type C4-dicarboxylate transport system permease large subunit